MSRKRSRRTRPPRPPTESRKRSGIRGSEPGDSRRRRRTLVFGVVAVAALAAGGVGVWRLSHSQAQGSGPGFNVLLITLDTTRADCLGCYGHPDNLTPNIDRLAHEGTMFTQCTAAAPSTLPSHATIMTATYPHVHGARHNVGYRLSEANATLAEAVKQVGYNTAAYVAAMVVNRDTGLDQGFDTYDDVGKRHERRADEVCNGAIDWLHAHAAETFFLWVHFFDPHAPYNPPGPFRTRYQDPYVGEIAFADQQVGRLLDELSRLGLKKRTLVVLTADHGEGLGQHGENTHLYFVYDTTMSVPLIFCCPGRIPRGGVVPTQVRNADIAPTVLAFLGIAIESALPDAQGTSLVPNILGEASESDLPAYGETLAGQIVLGTSPLRCLRYDGWKYIHAPCPELYDIRRDPGEEHNLASRQPDRAAAMGEQLREIVGASPARVGAGDSTMRLDREMLDRLASLGYVEGATDVSSCASDELARFDPVGDDPKDHAEDFVALGRATEFLQTGRFAEAEAVYRGLVSDFPDCTDLRMHLARSMFLQNKFSEAIRVYREVVAQRPDHAAAHYGLGKLLNRVGKRKEAIGQFAAAVQADPEYAEAHYDLGVALMKEGRGDEALNCFRQAVRIRPTYVDARINLGVGLAGQGKLDEAIEQYRHALRVAPDDAGIHYNLGIALARKGDLTAAIRAYDETLRLRPDFAAAREAVQLLRQGPPPAESQP